MLDHPEPIFIEAIPRDNVIPFVLPNSIVPSKIRYPPKYVYFKVLQNGIGQKDRHHLPDDDLSSCQQDLNKQYRLCKKPNI
jgi:hypothetical protein